MSSWQEIYAPSLRNYFLKIYPSTPWYKHSWSSGLEASYGSHVLVCADLLLGTGSNFGKAHVKPHSPGKGEKAWPKCVIDHSIPLLPTELLQLWHRHMVSKQQLTSPLNPIYSGKACHFSIITWGIQRSGWTYPTPWAQILFRSATTSTRY